MDNKGLPDAINQLVPYGKHKRRQLLDMPEADSALREGNRPFSKYSA